MKQRTKKKIIKNYYAWKTAELELRNGVLDRKDWKARFPYNRVQLDKALDNRKTTN